MESDREDDRKWTRDTTFMWYASRRSLSSLLSVLSLFLLIICKPASIWGSCRPYNTHLIVNPVVMCLTDNTSKCLKTLTLVSVSKWCIGECQSTADVSCYFHNRKTGWKESHKINSRFQANTQSVINTEAAANTQFLHIVRLNMKHIKLHQLYFLSHFLFLL